VQNELVSTFIKVIDKLVSSWVLNDNWTNFIRPTSSSGQAKDDDKDCFHAFEAVF